MARIAFFHPFSGASGDMALGALVNAGLPLAKLEAGLRQLGVDGWRFDETSVYRGAFAATRVRVLLDGMSPDADHPHRHGDHNHQHGSGSHSHTHGHSREHHHTHGHTTDGHSHTHDHSQEHGSDRRNLPQIVKLIEDSGLPEAVTANAKRVFEHLGNAEAKVHGMSLEEVHFHEVGAVDSIVDIVGTCLGLHLLDIDAVYSAPITVGTGYVRGDHGQMPLPAPATAELLVGFPIEQRETRAELTTPTGAALLTTLARRFGTLPPMTPQSIGYGAGDDRPGLVPNVLRVLIGEARESIPSSPPSGDRVLLLESNVDDMSPEWMSHLMERLFAAGALDVWLTPILMKKGRSAHELRVLAPLDKETTVTRTLFQESTTFGLRRREVDRVTLSRDFHTIKTRWGDVKIKVGRLDGDVLTAAPEYDDLRTVAAKAKKPLKDVHALVMAEYRKAT